MKTFNICDFGAKTCDALQTVPIQSAIDACFLEGGISSADFGNEANLNYY